MHATAKKGFRHCFLRKGCAIVSALPSCVKKQQVRMSEFADYTLKIPSVMYNMNNISLNQVLIV